jgi:hypothetical protein
LPKNGLNGFLLFFSRTKCCGSVPCAFIVFVCCRHIIPVRLIFVIFFHSPSGFLPPPSFSASASFPLGQFPAVAFSVAHTTIIAGHFQNETDRAPYPFKRLIVRSLLCRRLYI